MLEEQTSVRDQKHNLRTTAKWIYLTWGCKLMCGVCAKFSPSIKIGYQWMGVAAQCNVGVKMWVAHLWVAKQSLSRNHCYCTCWNRSKTVAQRIVLYVPNPGVKGTSMFCGASVLIVLFLSCSDALSPAGRLPVAAARIEAAAGAGIGASWRGLNDSRSSEWDLVH